MRNTTTRLAIQIDHLPPYDFSWDDYTPQKKRSDLTVDDVFPNVEDGRMLFERATQYTMRVLVEDFPALSGLKKFVAKVDQGSAVHTSTIVPMKLLFKDEKYTDDNIQILQEYSTECNLVGNPQVYTLHVNSST